MTIRILTTTTARKLTPSFTRRTKPTKRATTSTTTKRTTTSRRFLKTTTRKPKLTNSTVQCFPIKNGFSQVKCFKVSNQTSSERRKLSNIVRHSKSNNVQNVNNTTAAILSPKRSTTTTSTTQRPKPTRKYPRTSISQTTSANGITTTTKRKGSQKQREARMNRKITSDHIIQNRSFSAVDCGDKECSLRHQLLKDCTIFIHTNSTDCMIPCRMTGCKTETRHFINCPIWECTSKTTTTSTTTTTTPTTTTSTSTTSIPTTTLTPIPTPNPGPNNAVIISSVSVNVLFVMLAIGLVLYFKVLKPQMLRRRRGTGFVPLLANNDRYFTIGSDHSNAGESPPPPSPRFSEQLPMNEMNASLHERNPDSFEDIILRAPTRLTPSPAEAGAYHQSSPRGYSNYSTFKPETVQSENETETVL